MGKAMATGKPLISSIGPVAASKDAEPNGDGMLGDRELGEQDDRELDWLRRWRQGDPLAFESLVRRWQEPVARLLARLVTTPDAVPDLCQEVFLRVYQARGSFRGDAAVSTWIYRIAVNLARDAGRRHRLGTVSLNGQEPSDDRQNLATHCEISETAGLVARAIAELPESLREALVLRHYEQLSFEEMSRITGTHASTLKSRFSAALLRLRARLVELGLGPEDLS
jgi:RNA polymerase sigma-70 factor, ECF subfamily